MLRSLTRSRGFLSRNRAIVGTLNSSMVQRDRSSPVPSSCLGRSTTVRTRVFVSKHTQLNISSRDILDFFDHQGVTTHDARVTHSHVILRECPFCSKPTHDKADNLFKCYVQIGGGAYFCHRCGNGGSWYDLKEHFGGFALQGGPEHGIQSTPTNQSASTHRTNYQQDRSSAATHHRPTSAPRAPGLPLPLPSPRLQACYSTALLDSDAQNPVLKYLQEVRGLETRTLRKYGVGRAKYKFTNNQNQWQEEDCVTFPWLMSVADMEYQEDLRGAKLDWKPPPPDETTTMTPDDMDELKKATFLTRRIKVRALENKAWQRLDPPGGGWGLFGFHTIPAGAKEIVLTEGEYDAMAVWQATGRPTLSLPNGCRSLPLEVLPLLEHFEKIYLWMDNDAPGQEGAEQFAKKLGLQRCYLVRPTATNDENPPKDANEALLRGMDLEKFIQSARLRPHERILTFDQLRNDVLHEIMHPDKYSGVPMTSLPGLTKILKGFRRGEVTVLTGPTGSGKTTFLGQMSLDMAEQGINMLWGSFEIKNTRLLHKLLQQFSRQPLPDADSRDKLEALADRFSRLPMYFLKFHGGSDVDDILDAMDYAVYVNDVEHIILDNMQFMISRQANTRSTFDKFDVQDVAIEKFRKFATERNVHVTLVVHPRKESEDSKLSMASIYGSAKATQEADTVLILQHDGRKKYLEVKKNRFNGNTGICRLEFDRVSTRYTDQPTVEAKAMSVESYDNQLESHWDRCLKQQPH